MGDVTLELTKHLPEGWGKTGKHILRGSVTFN